METTVAEKVDWDELVAESYYETIWAIEQRIKAYDNEEALIGLHCLYENMNKRDNREFRSFLILLMTHILKWKYQPQKRSRSWERTIFYSRDEIQERVEDIPTVNKKYILSVWDKCFERAIRNAVGEMELSRMEEKLFNPESLTWQEVFEDDYSL
jgi:hypothetical protein